MARPTKQLEQYLYYGEIIKLINLGVSKRKIAKALGCSVGIVQQVAKKATLKFCGKSGRPKGTTLSKEHKEKLTEGWKSWYDSLSEKEKRKLSRPGEASGTWNGGLFKTKRGYWYVYSPEFATSREKHLKRSRYVVSVILGRKLTAQETVHHIDGDTENDHRSNLYLFDTRKEHLDYHRLHCKTNPIKESNLQHLNTIGITTY